TEIRGLIQRLYQDEVYARPLLERLASSGQLRIAKITWGLRGPAAAYSTSYIAVDVERISLAKIINVSGNVVFEDPALTIAHELKHLEGATDPAFPSQYDTESDAFVGSGADLMGDAVRFANNVAE